MMAWQTARSRHAGRLRLPPAHVLTCGLTTRHGQLTRWMTVSVMLPIIAFFMALRPREAAGRTKANTMHETCAWDLLRMMLQETKAHCSAAVHVCCCWDSKELAC